MKSLVIELVYWILDFVVVFIEAFMCEKHYFHHKDVNLIGTHMQAHTYVPHICSHAVGRVRDDGLSVCKCENERLRL